MDVRVLPVRSPRLSAGIEEVATMLDSAFRKRFRYSYDSSPSPTLLVRKRYRGTSELIFGTDSDEIDESLDSDSESEDAKDKGPTTEDEGPAAGDEGLAAGVEGSGVDDDSYGLDDESHGVDDESRGLDDEGLGIESDGLGLGEEDAVPEGQQQAALVVRTTVSTPLGLRQPTLTTWIDPEDGMAYIDVHVYPPPAPPIQTPPSPDWMPASLPISPLLSVVPLPVSSP
nr:hypothetical protein [Tanacetum cinerariifolium]